MDKFNQNDFKKAEPNRKVTVDFEISQIVILNNKVYIVQDAYYTGAIQNVTLCNRDNPTDIIKMETA